MNKQAVLVCVVSLMGYASQPPAKTIEECKARATSARRRCEIAYYSQCISESENNSACAAARIDFDCAKIEKQVYHQELEAMNNQNLKALKK